MAITSQPIFCPWINNRTIHATITTSDPPDADTPLSNLIDPRPGKIARFSGVSSLDMSMDLGPKEPWDIDVVALFCRGLSAAATVAFKSKAAAIDAYTTHETIALWPPVSSLGQDGFGQDALGQDEYPTVDTRKYPDDVLYFCLYATAKDHRYHQLSITDAAQVIEVALPMFFAGWRIPSNTCLTDQVTQATLDATTRTEGPLGGEAINPGMQRREMTFNLNQFPPEEAWEDLSYFFREQRKILPYLLFLAPTASANNIINTTDAAGRRMLGLTIYGTLEDTPGITRLPGYAENLVDLPNWRVREMK